MKKFPKIKRLGHDRTKDVVKNEGELLFKEKMDGASFRFSVNEDGELVFGSRNVEYKIDGEPDYTENVDERFTEAIETVREKLDGDKILREYGDKITFFAENMVKHTLDYNWEEVPQVIGFDIYIGDRGGFLPWGEVERLFESLGIETVDVVDRMKVSEFEPQEYEIPESNFRDGKMEGVVIIHQEVEEDHRSGFNSRAKLVTEEFAEKHKKATGARMSKEAIHGHEKIVSKYCTDARIEKTIHKMRDEGRELGMPMMGNKEGSPGLPVRVATDIIEEEAENIVLRNDKMNWKNYRKMVANRCKHVLQQEIQKQAGEEKIDG